LIWMSHPRLSTARLPVCLGWVGGTDQAAQIHATGPKKSLRQSASGRVNGALIGYDLGLTA